MPAFYVEAHLHLSLVLMFFLMLRLILPLPVFGVQESGCFLNTSVNGTIFAVAKELIERGANHKICIDAIQEITLASLRLKALLFKKMILQDDAKFAIFELSASELKATGASLKDCDVILKESLRLPYVEQALLLDVDNEYNIIKLKIKEI